MKYYNTKKNITRRLKKTKKNRNKTLKGGVSDLQTQNITNQNVGITTLVASGGRWAQK